MTGREVAARSARASAREGVARVGLILTVSWGVAALVRMLVVVRRSVGRRTCEMDRCRGGEERVRFVLLLPALREQGNIHRMLDALDRLDYPPELVTAIIVTSEREEVERLEAQKRIPTLAAEVMAGSELSKFQESASGIFSRSDCEGILLRCQGVPSVIGEMSRAFAEYRTTAQVVAEALSHRTGELSVHHLHAPLECSGKSGQLNFALEYADRIQGHGVEDLPTYVGTVDLDSSPDRRVLYEIARIVGDAAYRREELPSVVQALPLLLRRPLGVSRRILPATHAVMSIRHSLGVGAWRIMRRSELRRRGGYLAQLRAPLVYGVGSGLFVRREFIEDIGGYPAPVDDLAVGYAASVQGRRIEVAPRFILAERYATVHSLGAAYALVCLGSVQSYRALAGVPARHATRVARGILLAREAGDTVWWMAGLPFVLWMMWQEVRRGRAGIGLVIATVLVHGPITALACLLGSRVVARNFEGGPEVPERLSRAVRFGIVVTSPVQPLLHWMGPLYLARKAAERLRVHRGWEFGKTER